MGTTYTHAPEVEAVAEELISEYHPHLVKCAFLYVFKEPECKKGGKITYGSVRRLSGLSAFLVRGSAFPDAPEGCPIFIMEISKTCWARLDQKGRQAVVDHELCHVRMGTKGLVVVLHYLEEFPEVIARWGFYLPDRLEYAAACVKRWDQDFGDRTTSGTKQAEIAQFVNGSLAERAAPTRLERQRPTQGGAPAIREVFHGLLRKGEAGYD